MLTREEWIGICHLTPFVLLFIAVIVIQRIASSRVLMIVFIFLRAILIREAGEGQDLVIFHRCIDSLWSISLKDWCHVRAESPGRLLQSLLSCAWLLRYNRLGARPNRVWSSKELLVYARSGWNRRKVVQSSFLLRSLFLYSHETVL